MPISTAVPPSALARVLGIETIFVNRLPGGTLILPQRVALVGQGATNSVYPLTKFVATSAQQVGETVGYGTPLHLAAQQFLPSNGDGLGSVPLTIYPLEDDASGVAAVGNIIPVGAQTEAASYQVRIAGIVSQPFVIAAGDAVSAVTAAMTAAINSTLNMPFIASDNTTDVDLTAKWEGTSGNGLFVELVGTSSAGYTFTITQPAGGLVNPSVQPALDQVGDVWETMFLNCMEIGDSATLNLFESFGQGRWGALTRKPCVVFTGTAEADVSVAIAIPEGRKNDRVNCQLEGPDSPNAAFVIAARELTRIAVLANKNPAHDFGGQIADGLIPGPDGSQWLYTERDIAVKGGSSTVEVKNGLITLSDTVTFYHPDGDPTPAYRYVVDIVRLQNIIFNFDVEFSQAKWDGAPLIPNNQATTNSAAKKPRDAVAAAATIVDNLALQAILSDPATSKAGIIAEIDATNPKRLNLCVPVSLSGNTNIISMDLKFGFFFGTQALVA